MAEESNNYLVKLYRGDIPLVITFWVWNVVVATILYFVLSFMPILYYIIDIYFCLALWNSAGKYNGIALWKVLCKIFAALGLAIIALTIVFTLMAAMGLIEVPEELLR